MGFHRDVGIFHGISAAINPGCHEQVPWPGDGNHVTMLPGLVNVNKKLWKDPPFIIGKSTISMIISDMLNYQRVIQTSLQGSRKSTFFFWSQSKKETRFVGYHRPNSGNHHLLKFIWSSEVCSLLNFFVIWNGQPGEKRIIYFVCLSYFMMVQIQVCLFPLAGLCKINIFVRGDELIQLTSSFY